jgi:hypothetical protein
MWTLIEAIVTSLHPAMPRSVGQHIAKEMA